MSLHIHAIFLFPLADLQSRVDGALHDSGKVGVTRPKKIPDDIWYLWPWLGRSKKKKVRTFESLNCLGGANLDGVSRESEEAREG